MFRLASISIVALAITGAALAGQIDPGASSSYSSSDGPLFAGSSTLPEISSIVSVVSSASSIPTNTSQFAYNPLTTYTGSSAGQTAQCSIGNVFGEGLADCDNGATADWVFQDSTPGTLYTLTFTLPETVTIYGFNIYLQDAFSGNGNRAASVIDFYNGTASGTEVTSDNLLPNLPDVVSYEAQWGLTPPNILELTDTFAAQTGKTFTFTFVGPGAASGVRILDISSIDAPPAPEPGTWMLGGFGLLGLIVAVRMKNRRVASEL